MYTNWSQEQEDMSDQVAIGFSFVSDSLRGWGKFSRPITGHSEDKPMQSRITFDTQLKVALLGTTCKICRDLEYLWMLRNYAVTYKTFKGTCSLKIYKYTGCFIILGRLCEMFKDL